MFLFLSLSLTHAHTHTHTQANTHTHTHTHIHTHTHTYKCRKVERSANKTGVNFTDSIFNTEDSIEGLGLQPFVSDLYMCTK